MNKAQLIDALTARLGDRRAATDAVDAMVEVIVDTVGSGGSVTLTGFGVFEARRRAPRTARNPRTGETVPVAETVVPSFRPGAAFKERVADSEDAAAGATSAPRRAVRDRSAAGSTPARTSRRSRSVAADAPAGGTEGATAAKDTAAKSGGTRTTRTTATKKAVPPDTSAPGATEAPAKKKPASRKRATAAEK